MRTGFGFPIPHSAGVALYWQASFAPLLHSSMSQPGDLDDH
jgi:hypothetical protein